MKVKLAARKIELVVKELNSVLDKYNIFGQEWNKEVLKELILQNLTKDTTTKLMEELDKTPISDWND